MLIFCPAVAGKKGQEIEKKLRLTDLKILRQPLYLARNTLAITANITWGESMNAIRILIVMVTLLINAQACAESKSLLVFAGSASKPPTEEVAKVFESKTGVKVDLLFGGSGYVLSQMMLGKKGDIYFPGSSDFMETAKKKSAVYNETERKIVCLVPAMNVRKGNPKNIRKLSDLVAPGLRVAIARPDTVCVGLYAVEIIEKNLTKEQIKALRKNIVNYT